LSIGPLIYSFAFKRGAIVTHATHTRLLIVPGLGGSSQEHWQSHWEREHSQTRRVSQMDWDRPDLRIWLDRLRSSVEETPHAVLVGHSLGCILIAHLARRFPELPVSGALLVAPADVDFPEHLPISLLDFAPTPMGLLPFPATVVASTDDPYMSIARARQLSESWGANFIDVGACGHINVAAGFGQWRAGQRILAEFLESTRRTGHDVEYERHRQLARG
jgi:serine hydrolase